VSVRLSVRLSVLGVGVAGLVSVGLWTRGASGKSEQTPTQTPRPPKVFVIDSVNMRRSDQYVKALEGYYIPAKHKAQETGQWYIAYEVVRSISRACDWKDPWDPTAATIDLSSVPESVLKSENWEHKTILAARDAVFCIQLVRSEGQ